jgi:hypothetical protein
MKRLWMIPIAFMALAIPMAVLAGSGESGFDAVVSGIESRYHVRATRIPFLGLVSLIAHKATDGGANGLRLAEFENFTEAVDGQELNQMVEQKLGPGWERMIRETSRKGKNQTLIFVRPDGQRMEMLVVDRDGDEMDVVQVSVDAEHLSRQVGHWEHHGHDEDAPE